MPVIDEFFHAVMRVGMPLAMELMTEAERREAAHCSLCLGRAMKRMNGRREFCRCSHSFLARERA